jgi:hypothetical protein
MFYFHFVLILHILHLHFTFTKGMSNFELHTQAKSHRLVFFFTFILTFIKGPSNFELETQAKSHRSHHKDYNMPLVEL